MKHKKINLVKIVFDIIMSALLVLMFNKNVISMDFHEIGGLFLGGFILIHNLINWKWIVAVSKKIFSKSLALKLRLGYIINFLLLITMTLIIVSGIFISKTLFTNISLHSGNWKTIHYAASALSLILVGIHMGLHWGFIMGIFKKYIIIPAAIAKPVSVILVIAVVLFGSYSMFSSNFIVWLTAPFTTNQMKGGQPPENFNFQSKESNAGTDSLASGQNSNINNSKDSSTSDNSTTNSSKPTRPSRDKAFGKGDRQSSKDFPQNGDGTFPDRPGLPGSGERVGHGGNSNVLSVILTFISIMGVFATITYYCEKLLKRKKKLSQEITQT